MAGPRPFGVTLVAIIAWINGLFAVIGGIFSLFSTAGDVGATAAAWVAILIGVFTIAVSMGLFGGANGARIIATIVFALEIAAVVWVSFYEPWGLPGAFINGLLAILAIALLYSPRANEFFRD